MQDVLRLVDANLNRVREGLRFLEDVARFAINDAGISEDLRSLRHTVGEQSRKLGNSALSFRESEEDVGAASPAYANPDLPSLVRANAGRVEEGLRVLEEAAKLGDLRKVLNSDRFHDARFAAYTIEQKLLSAVMRREKAERLIQLVAMLDTGTLSESALIPLVRRAFSKGARTLELAAAKLSEGLLEQARKVRDLCLRHHALFIITDRLDLALATGADGLRIGQESLPAPELRRHLQLEALIGVNVRGHDQARKAQQAGADYLFLTPPGGQPPSLKLVQDIRKATPLPLVVPVDAVPEEAGQYLAAGAAAVALTFTGISDDWSRLSL